MLCPVLVLGYALSCTTLRVVGITTRSVVQLNLPTHVFNLDEALEARFKIGDFMVRKYCVGLAIVLTASSGLSAHEGHQPLPSKGVQVDTERGYITLSSQARSAIGLQTEAVAVGAVTSTLFAYAETVAPWQSKAYGSAQISGRITKLLVRPGDSVAKDQVVAELSSRELEILKLEYLQAKNDSGLNKQLLEMARPSAQAGAVPMQRLLDLENTYLQSENRIEIALIRARTLGVDPAVLEKSENNAIYHQIRSPIAGKVIHSDLSEGKFVDAAEHLFEIVNNDDTWVRLQVLEKDVFKVSIGQRVELEFADVAAKVAGTIDRMDAGLESKTQVSRAWVTISHPAVVPGLVGSATIFLTSQNDRMAVPLRSVYSDGLQSYVFVEEASTKSSAEYKKRNVTIGNRRLGSSSLASPSSTNPTSTNPYAEIVQGDVYPGDRVVVKGGHELSSLFFLGVLKLSEAERTRLGIVTAYAAIRPIADVIPLAAAVTLPPENRSVASSQLAGTIRSHTLSPGREVRTGELLMEIASSEFYALQLDLLKTSLDAKLSRLRARRLEEVKNDAFSRRVLLEILSQAEQLEDRIESLKQQLISLGLFGSEVDAIIMTKRIYDYLPIRAQIDGRLISWSGTLGQTIIANQALVEIQNLSSLWIEAYVPTKMIDALSAASHGQASVLSNPEIQFPVSVSRIGPVVSETTRTKLIWLTLDTGAGPTPFQLRDRMQLSVLIKSTNSQKALAVPLNAVLRDGLHSFVFVQKPDDYLERRRVTIGRSDGEFVEIIHGVVVGEAVVSAGGRELQTAFASLR